MNKIIKWKDRVVDVQARLVPRLLWTTASIDIFLDGQCILRTGGRMSMNLRGSHSDTFTHSGSKHMAALSWGYGFLQSFPYKLQIDGTPISEARVHVRNRRLGLIWMALLAAELLSAFYIVR